MKKSKMMMIVIIIFSTIFLCGCFDETHYENKTTTGILADVKTISDKYLILYFKTNQTDAFDIIGFKSYSIEDYVECNLCIGQSVFVNYTYCYTTSNSGNIISKSNYFRSIEVKR